MGAVGAGLQIAGGVTNMMAQVQARKANAAGLNLEAQSVESAAAYDEGQVRRSTALARGTANAQAAASGVQISTGTSLFHELDRVKQSELEALNVRRTGAVRAQGLRYGANMERKKIPFDILSGVAGTAASALSGYENASILSKMKKK